MALFKPFMGSRTTLDAQEKHEGYAYFCTDDGSFHIDYIDANGVLQRKQINAKDAETLGAHTADEFLLESDVDTVKQEITGEIVTNLSGELSNIEGRVNEKFNNKMNTPPLKGIPGMGFAQVSGILKGTSTDINFEFAEPNVDYVTPDKVNEVYQNIADSVYTINEDLSRSVDGIGNNIDLLPIKKICSRNNKYKVKQNQSFTAIWEPFRLEVEKISQWAAPTEGTVNGVVGGIATLQDPAQCAFLFKGMGDPSPANTLEILLYLDGNASTNAEQTAIKISSSKDASKYVQWNLGGYVSQLKGGWHKVRLPYPEAVSIDTIQGSLRDVDMVSCFSYWTGVGSPATIAMGDLTLMYCEDREISISTEGCVLEFERNEEDGTKPATRIAMPGDTIILHENPGTKTGYEFKGWQENEVTNDSSLLTDEIKEYIDDVILNGAW